MANINVTKMSSKGQIVIPSEMRSDLKEGDEILIIKDEVSTGTQLNVAMKNSQLFPNMVVQMTAIGEEAGSMDAMLSKVADFYEEEVDNAVDGLSSLLEPLIMAILGGLIGGLVIAMYMPIFQMGKIVGGAH